METHVCKCSTGDREGWTLGGPWPASSDKSAPGSERNLVSWKKTSDVELWTPRESTHADTHHKKIYTHHTQGGGGGRGEGGGGRRWRCQPKVTAVVMTLLQQKGRRLRDARVLIYRRRKLPRAWRNVPERQKNAEEQILHWNLRENPNPANVLTSPQ